MTARAARQQLDPDLAGRLVELRRRDQAARAELAAEGSLFEGYHPRIEAVHRANARALAAILDEHGWPGRSRAGDEGVEAAWIVAQHAISEPAFQRRCLALLRRAVSRGEAPARQAAMLEDRIRFNQRRPQRFGTIFDWDEAGELSPWSIAEPEAVDSRRAAVGLPPLAEATAELRRRAAAEGERAPDDWAARQRKLTEWARAAGWIGDGE